MALFYVLINKSKPVKIILLFTAILHASLGYAQTSADTGTLKAQKENVITANTILKIENLGVKVNSDLAELRPTISADGNLLFLFVKIILPIQNIIRFRIHRISGLQKETVAGNGAKQLTLGTH